MMHGAHPGFLLEAVFSLPKYWSQSCVKRYIHYAICWNTQNQNWITVLSFVCACRDNYWFWSDTLRKSLRMSNFSAVGVTTLINTVTTLPCMYILICTHTHAHTTHTCMQTTHTHTHTTHTHTTHTHTTHTHTHTHTHTL